MSSLIYLQKSTTKCTKNVKNGQDIGSVNLTRDPTRPGQIVKSVTRCNVIEKLPLQNNYGSYFVT